MEGRDAASPVVGGGNIQQESGGLGFPVQQRTSASMSTAGLHTPAPLRPATTVIALASPTADGTAAPPHNLVNMGRGQVGATYNSAVASPNVVPETQKRKRGRPRKYATDGSAAGAAAAAAAAQGGVAAPGGGDAPLGTQLALSTAATKLATNPTEKRGRGRPPGSGKKQQLAALAATADGALLSGSAGAGFTPHVITIAAGEDVANKIFAFSQQGPRAVCVLSANGSISNVTLRHDSSFGGNITYEGRYEILSLSGSFLPTDVNAARSRTGGLSVSLAASDGKVVGGSVSGLLVSATPVQIVVGSFAVPESSPTKPCIPGSPPQMAGNGESMVALMTTSIGLSPPLSTPGVTIAAVPLPTIRPSKIETSGSKGIAASSAGNHQIPGNAASTPHQAQQFGGWQPNSPADAAMHPSTDINISLPGG